MSAWSERQRLEAEYQDLNYLWEEEGSARTAGC